MRFLMLDKIEKLIVKAGDAIMSIYAADTINVLHKEDSSPLTQADLLSNKILLDGLATVSHYPILSEETDVNYDIRKNWPSYWCIDPLDGTKDFLAKNNEFAVNVALICAGVPILGYIYAPALNMMYFAEKGNGAYKNGVKIYNNSSRTALVAAESNFHHNIAEPQSSLLKHTIQTKKQIGASLKFGLLAEGQIDVYIRMNGSKEWDTAAGHILIEEAGCEIYSLPDLNKIRYGNENVRNPYFVAARMGVINR